MRQAQGFTLLEVMMVTGLMTIVMGALFSIALAFGDTARVQSEKMVTQDEARRALLQLSPKLRNAQAMSVNWGALPGKELSFRAADDIDGNGSAVNQGGQLELTPVQLVKADVDDLNGDGLTTTQLVLTDGTDVTVLANNLSPSSETTGVGGVFGPTQDTNSNGRLDRGFWVEASNGGIRVTLQTLGETRRGNEIVTELSELVIPRN